MAGRRTNTSLSGLKVKKSPSGNYTGISPGRSNTTNEYGDLVSNRVNRYGQTSGTYQKGFNKVTIGATGLPAIRFYDKAVNSYLKGLGLKPTKVLEKTKYGQRWATYYTGQADHLTQAIVGRPDITGMRSGDLNLNGSRRPVYHEGKAVTPERSYHIGGRASTGSGHILRTDQVKGKGGGAAAEGVTYQRSWQQQVFGQ